MSKKNTALSNFEGFEFGSEGNPTEFIPSGHAELDYIIASGLLSPESKEKGDVVTGGFPTGKVVMIYGEPGGGKSSLGYAICGSAQRMGKVPIWIDVENSFSESLAKINGVDLNKIGRKSMYDKSNPDKVFDGEYALDAVMDACKRGAGVVVLDSIASLVPRFVMDNPSEKDTMAALARLLGKTVNKICSFAAANNTLVVFINQLRLTPGAMFKDPEGFPGGKAIAHASSVILKVNQVRRKDSYTYIEDDSGNPKMIAGSANVFIQKNRFAAPHFGGINIPIYYENYFPKIEETVFEVARQTKTVSIRNGVYSWNGIKVEGKKAFITKIVEDLKLDELVNEVKKDASENKVILPAAILNYEKHIAFTNKNKDKIEKGTKKAMKQKTKEDELNDVIGDGPESNDADSFNDSNLPIGNDNPEI